ncbi:MAG: 16S rRNA (adenine(1518)-N(6)/adenine(1519)-N(6))-dimethyltransferase RsmA [Candidatus Paceibacterota bacterium]|jgi:16S rRNA (adenine1518-N6/adenine1519-N6)-dimethyltransferase
MNTVRLKKGLGQNLLKDQNQIRKIMASINLSPNDTVLEIGPGLGAITLEMAKIAKTVVCIEKDQEMVTALTQKLKEENIKNVEIINEDILRLFNNDKLNVKVKKYKIVANIPYYLTSVLIRNLLEIKNPPEDIFLMIQKEVGERICAKPGDMSILAIAVQYYANPKILFTVPKGCFLPSPKIDSVFIRITPKGVEKNDEFFKLIKAGFSHPRKQLIGNLYSQLKIDKEIIKNWLKDANLKPGERAEVLSLSQWDSLFTLLKKK